MSLFISSGATLGEFLFLSQLPNAHQQNELMMPSLVAQTVKRLPTMRETRVRSLGRGRPLEKEMAIHSSVLVWEIPQTKEPGGLQSMSSDATEHPHMHGVERDL